jgi:hypothetical protein
MNKVFEDCIKKETNHILLEYPNSLSQVHELFSQLAMDTKPGNSFFDIN